MPPKAKPEGAVHPDLLTRPLQRSGSGADRGSDGPKSLASGLLKREEGVPALLAGHKAQAARDLRNHGHTELKLNESILKRVEASAPTGPVDPSGGEGTFIESEWVLSCV